MEIKTGKTGGSSWFGLALRKALLPLMRSIITASGGKSTATGGENSFTMRGGDGSRAFSAAGIFRPTHF